MRQIHTHVIHCTATPSGKPFTVEDIRRMHMTRKPKPFSDIGYHFLIDIEGKLFPGRPFGKRGAHAVGHNTGTIATVYVGGHAPYGTGIAGPNQAQLETLRIHHQSLAHAFELGEPIGHRDLGGVNKDCPCFDVAEWWRTGIMKVTRNLA